MLLYDTLDQFPDYLVQVINSHTGDTISGLIDNEEFTYTLGANVSGSLAAGGLEAGVKGVASAVAQRALGGMGKTIINNFKTSLSTYKSYEDSQDSNFSISMHIFPGKSGNGEYPSIVEGIAKLTQPNTEDSRFLQSYLYDPADIKKLATAEDPFKGKLIHVSIGNWFLATGLFCVSAPPSFSKFVDVEGKPLYMRWDATFTPYKTLNAKEIAAWHLI